VFTLFESLSVLGPWAGAPEWLSMRVFVCGAVAVGLAAVSLLLKGMQKVITLLIAGTLVLGAVWLLEDAWAGRDRILPPELATELDSLARQGLKSAEAQAAWQRLKSEWAAWTGDARSRLAAGGDGARKAVALSVENKAAELRRLGKKSAADELMRFRAKLAPSE
jgi:hypothetical protein